MHTNHSAYVISYLHLSIVFINNEKSLQVLRSLGNLIAGDSHASYAVLVPGLEVTG